MELDTSSTQYHPQSQRRLIRSSALRSSLKNKDGQVVHYGGPPQLTDQFGRQFGTNGQWRGGELADTTVNTGIRIGGTSPDSQKVEIAYVGFGTRLNNALATYEAFYPRIATVVTTPKASPPHAASWPSILSMAVSSKAT